jgi:hypothetical protein
MRISKAAGFFRPLINIKNDRYFFQLLPEYAIYQKNGVQDRLRVTAFDMAFKKGIQG